MSQKTKIRQERRILRSVLKFLWVFASVGLVWLNNLITAYCLRLFHMIRLLWKFANLFKVWLYIRMKTKIFFSLVLLSLLGCVSFLTFANDPCTGGWYWPGCDDPCPDCDNKTTPPGPNETPPRPPDKTPPNRETALIYYYCSNTQAINYQTQSQCRASNYARIQDSCIINNTVCAYEAPNTSAKKDSFPSSTVTYFYCARTSAPNHQTQSQCRIENKARSQDSCIIDNTLCTYWDNPLNSNTSNWEKNITEIPGNQPGSIDKTNSAGTTTSQTNSDSTAFSNNEQNVTPTSCLQSINETPIQFSVMPDFMNLSAYQFCSNNGAYTKTTYTFQGNSGSFSGYCENPVSIDNNKERCTYLINLPEIVTTVLPPFFISGTVSGAENSPLPNIQITLTSLTGKNTTITDGNGNYIFSGLAIGQYSLRPDNAMPHLFPNSEAVKLQNSNATINFSAIDSTQIIKNEELAKLLNTESTSVEEWLADIANKWNTIGGNDQVGMGLGIYDRNGAETDGAFSSLLNNWNSSLSDAQRSAFLSLLPQYPGSTNTCGDKIKQIGETCDDGVNNGKIGYCSSDCRYTENRIFVTKWENNADWVNIATSKGRGNNGGIFDSLQSSSLFLGRKASGGIKILQTSIWRVSDAIGNSQNFLKRNIIANTTPRTRRVIRKTAEVTVEVAQYSVIALASVIWIWALSLNFMAYKAHWASYTVQVGDTFDSIGNQFTMTERAMRGKNGLKKWDLQPGTKIKVRNRHFIEKEYLDQLKYVLQDSLEKRNYGKMSAKIDKMFAKK